MMLLISVYSILMPSPDVIMASVDFYVLQFGEEELAAMPSFISDTLPQVVFSLLAHPQQTVRENAIKTYSAYISKCEFKVSVEHLLLCGKNVMQQESMGCAKADGLRNLEQRFLHATVAIIKLLIYWKCFGISG